MRTTFAIALGICLPGLALSQQSDLAKDPNLQKPISERMKIVSLKEVISTIAKQTGASVDVGVSIRDLKVTVLVDHEPAYKVLDGIASVVGGTWAPNGSAMYLSISPDQQKLIRDYIQKENGLLHADADRKVKGLVDLVHTGPKDGLPLSPDQTLLGRMFSAFSSSSWSAFWAGEVAATSGQVTLPTATTDAGAAPTPPGRGRRGGPGGAGGPGGRNGMARAQAFARFDPTTGDVEFLASLGPRGGAIGAKSVTQTIKFPFPPDDLAQTPFGKAALAWNTELPTDKAVLNQPVTIPPMKASVYSNHLFSVADYLEAFFDGTKLPVIADAFRVPSRTKDPVSGATALDWMTAYRRLEPTFLRYSNGEILIRHGGFWRLRVLEAPETYYAPIEKKAIKSGVGLFDYADFAARLTPEQSQSFRSAQTVLVKFDPSPLNVAYPALRFLGGLSSDQKAILASGRSLNEPDMSPSQRSQFAGAILLGPFVGAQVTGNFLSALESPELLASMPQLGFVLQRGDIRSRDGGLVGGAQMFFGANPRNGVFYSVPLPEGP